MSHAVLLETLDSGAIWAVARGLARNVQRYQALLANCDRARPNGLDGRGTLSEEALAEFSHFFLQVCLDQVTFMEGFVEPERLRTRVLLWAAEEMKLGALPPKAGSVLRAVLYRGELPCGEAGSVVAAGDRHARRIVSAPLRLAFSAALASRWMPGLFPEK
jgi:hypothetical protein